MKKEDIKKRIKENFKKNKVLLFGFIIVWSIIIAVSFIYYDSTIGKLSIGNESYDRSVLEIDKSTEIVEILPVEDKAESVSVLFATYARANEGNINIKVNGINTNKTYANKTINVNNIQDNAYITVRLNEDLDINLEKCIRVTITSNSELGKAVGLYYSNVDWFDEGYLLINGNRIKHGDLCIKYLVHDEQLKGFSDAVIISTVVFISLIALLLLLINPRYELLFAIIILALGLIMMIIIVPAAAPDELSHYEVVLQVSNKMMFKDTKTIDSIYLKYGYMYGHYNISPGYIRFLKEFGKPLKLTGKEAQLSRNIDNLYLVQYLPQAIGVTLGRLLNLNMITTFYLSRFTSLLFYVVCVYIAIKKAPSFKFLLGMLASLPMLVQIGMAISYDCWILGLSFLTIGYFLKWYFSEDRISIFEFVFVFLICLGLAPAKVLYSFFAFLFIFVPSSKYGSKIKKLIMVLIIIAPGVWQLYDIMKGPIAIFFDMVLKSDLSNNYIKMWEVEIDNSIGRKAKLLINNNTQYFGRGAYSFGYMIKYPIDTLMIFLRTIRYKIKFWFYGSLGRCLAGDTLVLPLTIVHLLALITGLSSFVKQEKTFGIPMKSVLVIMCVIIGLYAMIGMFVSWTDIYQEVIEDFGGILVEGIQGRYFSPVLPYFFVIFANKKIALPKRSEKYILLAYLFIFFEIVLYVLSYTFVN